MLHTITLITTKRILADNGYLKLTNQLIANELVEVDYFGAEPDNQADYVDEEMQDKLDKFTFINIYFEGEEIDYSSFSDIEILKLATKVLSDPKEGSRAVANENDIDIYI